MLVCKTLPDAFVNSDASSCKVLEEKVSSLEWQVRQLQNAIGARNDIDDRRHFDGLPKDCKYLFDNGTVSDGVYFISPDGRCPFQVYCDMTNGSWTLIQKRQDGTVNFHRTWNEYVQDFGDLDGEHWLGLDKLHRLTKDGTEIYFDMIKEDGTKDNAHYKVFTVHGASTQYTMNVDAFGYVGTVKELFTYHDGQRFSTFDSDNDSNGGNCCETLDGACWWYKSCVTFGSFNGVYGKKGQGGITYHDGGYITLKHVNIKIKPRYGLC